MLRTARFSDRRSSVKSLAKTDCARGGQLATSLRYDPAGQAVNEANGLRPGRLLLAADLVGVWRMAETLEHGMGINTGRMFIGSGTLENEAARHRAGGFAPRVRRLP